jgi:hypothetical protein
MLTRHHLTTLVGTIVLLLSACVETDIVPDPPPTERPSLTLSAQQLSMLAGQQMSITATYRDGYQRVLSRAVRWASQNPAIATITSTGLVLGVAPGQVLVTATVDDTVSATALVNVGNSPSDIATVTISPSIPLPLAPNQLSSTTVTFAGTVLTPTSVLWQSSNASVASVTSSGLVTALSTGSTQVTSTVLGIASPSVLITVIADQRSATLIPSNIPGDMARGSATLRRNAAGELELQFSSNSGPALYVYLTRCANLNSSNISTCGFVDLGRLKQTSGAHTYAVPSSVALNDYTHVMVYCRAFFITFGAGQLQ